MLVKRAGPADVDAVAPLFDAYRQFYGQRSDLAAARAFLEERLRREESVIFFAVDGGVSGSSTTCSFAPAAVTGASAGGCSSERESGRSRLMRRG
jgi:hypothetical protein